MKPQFPLDLRNPPTCRECGRPCTRKIVGPQNPIGNPGRPYYACDDDHENLFSTWDDYEGITNGNPPCKCAPPFVSRRDRSRKGVDFYSCPNRFNGGCGWTRTCNDQLAIVPRPNSIPVAGTVPQFGAQHPLYAAQFSAQYDPRYSPQHGSQYNSQYGSQYGSQNGPGHFPQQFPQSLSPNVPPQFPQQLPPHASQHAPRRQIPPQSRQDIPQYRDSRPWASPQVPVNERGRSCCLLM
jgi:hypothetical protein